ncbi:NAF1-domain-containing protein [Nadsonia fulvescens var. elongata DSM 6958]|uniref:H/ACA ribonucleoprotein complex non-core subunit NAF1 n=1 Tax=Nadsonia fulvescens var. elongata DSM 6958 TaxID=857566 RepID=A0A1E3PRS5_9ASCO|nr:NAF1-domain-containing protein [Nadsonia fulvescens var. elongata DSM 6958]
MSEEEHISKRFKPDDLSETASLELPTDLSAVTTTITPAVEGSYDISSLSTVNNEAEVPKTICTEITEISNSDVLNSIPLPIIDNETTEIASEEPKITPLSNTEFAVSEADSSEDFQIITNSNETPIDNSKEIVRIFKGPVGTVLNTAATTEVKGQAKEIVNNETGMPLKQSMPEATETDLVDAIDLALLNPDADLHFSSDDENIPDNIDLGSDSNSDSSSSDSDESSDVSDSESDSENESNEDNGIKLDGLSDDEDSVGPLRTKNEIVDAPVPILPEDFVITPQMAIEPIGTLLSVLDSTAVIKASVSGEFRVLDDKSVFCFGDRSLIGMLFETFGRVQAPMYTVKFKDPEQTIPLKSRKGETVYYVVSNASFIYTDNIKAIKGSDASNWHDEEIPIEEQEHSDDEKEMEQKSKLKAKKKSKKKTAQSQLNTDEKTNSEPSSTSTKTSSKTNNTRMAQNYGNKQPTYNGSINNFQIANNQPNPRQQQFQQHQFQHASNLNQGLQHPQFSQFNGGNGVPPQFVGWSPNAPPFSVPISMPNSGGMFPLQPLPMDPRMYFPPPGNQPPSWVQQSEMIGILPFQAPPTHHNFVSQNQNQRQHQQSQFQQQFPQQFPFQNQPGFQSGNYMPQFESNNTNPSNSSNNGYNSSNNAANSGQPPSTLNYE